MRFTLAQLRKFTMPYAFSDDVDLKSLIGFESILDITNLKIEGVINRVDNETYEITFKLVCDLVLECAITLKPVPYHIDTEFKEIFATDESDEAFKIDGQTLDTQEAIITNLLINKPVNVYAEGASFTDEDEKFPDEVEEERKVNPAFESLKDLL